MLSLALLLAAAAGEYRALGTEPFWSLMIGGGRMRLEQVGLPTIVVAAPRARRIRDGRRYAGRGMIVRVVRRSCDDGMSDRTFPDMVTVVVGRRMLRGCGGVPTGPAWPIG